MSFLLYPVYPDTLEYKDGDLLIYDKFQGIMGRCCSYKLTERRILIFEKELGMLDAVGGIDFENAKIVNHQDQVQLTYELDRFDAERSESFKQDTTIWLGK